MGARFLLAGALWAVATLAAAQEAAPVPSAPVQPPPADAAAPEPALPAAPPATAAAPRHLTAGTVVRIEIVEALSSKTAVRGARFTIRLAEPILEGGEVIAPAGAAGVGEVVHAAKGGMGGKAGELILAARYVEVNDTRLPLKALKFNRAGDDRTKDAMAASMAIGLASPIAGAVIGLAMTGGEVNVPAGARADAKLAADIPLPLAPPAALATAPPPPATSDPGTNP